MDAAPNSGQPNHIARLVRNVALGFEFLFSHMTHFYVLAALSYVKGPPMAPWTPYFDDSYYGAAGIAQPGTGDPVAEIAGATTIWGKIIQDYLLALHYKREALDAAALFTGRTPMMLNTMIGGVGYRVSSADVSKAKEKLYGAGATGPGDYTGGVYGFIKDHYVPLTEILAVLYPAYDNGTNGGQDVGSRAKNCLAYGVFDEDNLGGADPNRLLTRGYVLNGAPTTWANVDFSKIMEHTTNSRYSNVSSPLSPSNGETNPNFSTGYSWVKAPRYDGNVMEVGPFARMVVQGARAPGANKEDSYRIGATKNQQDDHATIGASANDLGGGATYTCGSSAMDRHRARALEALKIAKRMQVWLDALLTTAGTNGVTGDGAAGYSGFTRPTTTVSGFGAHEAPRGALGHWVSVDSDLKITKYQCVVPTTWNASPRDGSNIKGAIESALTTVPTPLSGVKSGGQAVPVEALRVIQSFDPCIACAVHVVDGKKLKSKEVTR